MRQLVKYLFALIVVSGCTVTNRFQVTKLGEEPPEVLRTYMYALPRTVLKVEITFQEIVSIPGPYKDFAEKYLSITEVIDKKSSQWRILDVDVTSHTEMDPDQVYSLNLMEGEFNEAVLEQFIAKGVIVDGTGTVESELAIPAGQDPGSDFLRFLDLGVYSNFEERTETMYKTLVTDTSYVRVPVERTIVEQKSPTMKASEAADLILDLRTRRLDLLTGEYEVFPQGEAMQAAISKLDQLEESYLSLFTGRTFSRMERKSYFIVPESGTEPSRYGLDLFSAQLGFVPAELMEGEPIEVRIKPMGQTSLLGIYHASHTGMDPYDHIYYRIPDVTELTVVHGGKTLFNERISIYQAGAIVRTPATL